MSRNAAMLLAPHAARMQVLLPLGLAGHVLLAIAFLLAVVVIVKLGRSR